MSSAVSQPRFSQVTIKSVPFFRFIELTIASNLSLPYITQGHRFILPRSPARSGLPSSVFFWTDFLLNQYFLFGLSNSQSLRAQDKSKQYYCCFLFFLIFILLCDSRKIHYLTREFHVKLHTKTVLRDSCDVSFRVQFNAEFPRQAMNFPKNWFKVA